MSNTSETFRNDTRIHIGLRTSDLDGAIRFYTLLLGSDPVKTRPDYAKWSSDDPSVNLSVSLGSEANGQAGAHYGVQAKSTEAVQAAKARFEAAGVSFHSEDQTVCCYALQDKFWVADPDGNAWEVYVVLEDSEMFRSDDSECCAAEEGQTEAAACC